MMNNSVNTNKKATVQPVVDFSSSVWFDAELTLLTEHLNQNMMALLKSYPESDATTLRMMLARRHNLEDNEIIPTNAPTAAFHLIAETFKGSRVLLPQPCLPQIENACKLYDCQITYVPVDTRMEEWPLEEIDLCFITTPNVPDGHILSHADLTRTLSSHPQVKFVINQSYASFTTTNQLKPEHVRSYPNSIMIWSFSQPYGIPGLRIGYITADAKLATQLWQYHVPSTLTCASLEAAKYILIHPAQFTLPIRKWLRQAQELMTKLRQIEGVELTPSDTTFFLMQVKGMKSLEELQKALLEKYNIKVALGSEYCGLDSSYLCITARNEEENQLLISAMEALLQESGSSAINK